MRYALGVDLGSSGLKLSLMNEEGDRLGPFGVEISTNFPFPGWAEQQPDMWYEAFLKAFSKLRLETGIDPARIVAVAVDGATHTTVLLDEKMRPVRDAIMWNDQRSAEEASYCRAIYGQEIERRTYHSPSAMWSLCQLLWIKRKEPQIWEKAKHFLFAKDYLRWRMGGGYVTDMVDAQGSALFNMEEKCWDPFLCGILDLSPKILPEMISPLSAAGYINKRCSQETGLKEGTIIYGGASDTAMELLAAGAVKQGDATVKLATSGRICIVTDRAYPHTLLVNYSHVVPGLWYPGTGTKSCATSLRWFKDQFCGQEAEIGKRQGRNVYEILDEAAKIVNPGSEGLFFHPYLLGEFTPYQDPELRAGFTGASMKHTREHFIHAVMEGCAYSLLDCRKTLEEIGVPLPNAYRLIGGGAAGKVWSQIVADVFQCPFQKKGSIDSSCGSAMVAAVGGGFFASFSEAVETDREPWETVWPNPEHKELYKTGFSIYKEIQRVLQPVYHSIAGWQRETE